MRQLRSCDFCGDDAAGTFEIVPPALQPTEAEQRRVSLCRGCRDRLEVLLEPLLARAGADGADPAGTDGRGATTDGEIAPRADERGAGSTAGSPGASGPSAGSQGAGGPSTGGANADASDGHSTSSQSDREPPAAPGDEPAVDGDESGGPESTTVPEGESDEEAADSETTAGPASPGSETADGSSGTSTGSSETADGSSAPSGYGKAMRLLRNREFPVDRADVEGLLAGAYDLEDPEVEAVVDHALEEGRLVEERGQLRRP